MSPKLVEFLSTHFNKTIKDNEISSKDGVIKGDSADAAWSEAQKNIGRFWVH